jgi:hypothetical protein
VSDQSRDRVEGEIKRIVDAAWPSYGGNHQTAEFWEAFVEGVRFTLEQTAAPAGQSAPIDAASDPLAEAREVLEEPYLIRKGGYYYRPNRCGYTATPHDAGRYTKEEAEAEASIEPWHMSAVKLSDVLTKEEEAR